MSFQVESGRPVVSFKHLLKERLGISHSSSIDLSTADHFINDLSTIMLSPRLPLPPNQSKFESNQQKLRESHTMPPTIQIPKIDISPTSLSQSNMSQSNMSQSSRSQSNISQTRSAKEGFGGCENGKDNLGVSDQQSSNQDSPFVDSLTGGMSKISFLESSNARPRPQTVGQTVSRRISDPVTKSSVRISGSESHRVNCAPSVPHRQGSVVRSIRSSDTEFRKSVRESDQQKGSFRRSGSQNLGRNESKINSARMKRSDECYSHRRPTTTTIARREYEMRTQEEDYSSFNFTDMTSLGQSRMNN